LSNNHWINNQIIIKKSSFKKVMHIYGITTCYTKVCVTIAINGKSIWLHPLTILIIFDSQSFTCYIWYCSKKNVTNAINWIINPDYIISSKNPDYINYYLILAILLTKKSNKNMTKFDWKICILYSLFPKIKQIIHGTI
jgi:hypothetical protein